ncbi:MAG: hypothetical protein NTW79_04370 [Candidatus Berkelbacteria bacterium]|nr:hypothetical protein [Candidatus Berkelbacteria bacterium]
MKIEIDQSGKIENTNKPTVIAYSGDKNKSLIIFAGEKQKLQKYFRRIGKPSSFVYIVFAVLIFILIKSEKTIDEIIIDREYAGQEPLIKNYLIQFIKKSDRHFDKKKIYFHQIGKKSPAHDLSVKSFRKKKADIKVKSDDVLKFLTKLKSGV